MKEIFDILFGKTNPYKLNSDKTKTVFWPTPDDLSFV